MRAPVRHRHGAGVQGVAPLLDYRHSGATLPGVADWSSGRARGLRTPRRCDPVARGDAHLVRHLAADVRRPRRTDRGDAAPSGRSPPLAQSAPVPARAELLHAAPRSGGAAAGDLHRMAAQRGSRRPDRRHPVRAARDAGPARPLGALRGVRRHRGGGGGVRRAGPGRHRHRGPGGLPVGPAVLDRSRVDRARRGGLRRADLLRRAVPGGGAGGGSARLALQPTATGSTRRRRLRDRAADRSP